VYTLLHTLRLAGIAPVATLGRWTKAAGAQASALLAVLDEDTRDRVRQAAADEIYVRDPVRMVVEPESLCWVSGRLTDAATGKGWAEQLRSLPALEQVTRDGGARSRAAWRRCRTNGSNRSSRRWPINWTISIRYAASLVECINSVLRMQQARHRNLSQGLLDLKRLYWNSHTFRTGRRRGKTPYGILGVPWPEGLRWWDLLKWSPEQLRDKLSALKKAE